MNVQLFCVTMWLHLKPLTWVYLSWAIVSVGCLLSLLCSCLLFQRSSGCKCIWRSRILIFWHMTCYSICHSALNRTVAQLCQAVALCRLFYCQDFGYLHDEHSHPVGSQGRWLLLTFPVKLRHFCCRGQTPSLGQVCHTMQNGPLFSACVSDG